MIKTRKYRPVFFAIAWGVGLFALLAQGMIYVKNASMERNRDVGAELEMHILRSIAEQLPVIRPDETADLLVEAIIQIESAGNPQLVGAAGERGLMQIKENTWREMSRRIKAGAVPFERAFESDLNEQVGRLYLAHLQRFLQRNQAQWKSDERALLLACYNAGPYRVKQAGFNLDRLPAAVRDYVERGTALHEYFLADKADPVRAMLEKREVRSQDSDPVS